MKHFTIAALALCLGLSAALAQTTTPVPDPIPAPATSPPQTTGGASAQPNGKEAHLQCRNEAIAKGLKGPARKADVQGCFAKARPDLAAAQQCREQAKAKGLADKELRAFVKQCKTGAQQ